MSNTTSDYFADARADAKSMAEEFVDEIIEKLLEGGDASTDLYNDYPNGDSYHHENHVDRDYDLSEAAELLNQLSDHEETDTGLWEGLEPRKAINAQAAYTYGNAVYAFWREIIEEINDSEEIGQLVEMLEHLGESPIDQCESAEQAATHVKACLKELLATVIEESI